MKKRSIPLANRVGTERSGVRLPPDERIAEIEVAARQELAQKGHQDFQPSEVARRCGVSEATVYRYFPTKRDLLIKVAEDWFAEILNIEPEIAQQSDTFGRLRHVIRHSLRVIQNQPALSRFVLQDLRLDPAYRSMRIFELNRRFTNNVVHLVKEAVAAGQFRPGMSPVLVRNLIYGAVEHHTWSFLRGEGELDLDATADGIADMIFHGVSMKPIASAQMLEPLVSKLESDADSLRSEIRRLAALLSGSAGSY